MKFGYKFTVDALDDLATIQKDIAQRIVKKVMYDASLPNPLHYAKRLSGDMSSSYRFRIGDYRALFVLEGDWEIQIIQVYKIEHRKDIY